ncbi:MAG: tripartite tricarboxylate transporter substrate binding protein [Piscinibacter sp.]|nr:tripartite tricarboxylate transporter substrate binding protein [Piscinibacter sp.]
MLTSAATHLGQSMVFENVAGAGGNIGSVQGARAEPDGYTMLYGTNGTLGINQTLYAKPGFDPVKDFVPVSRLSEIPLVMVVRQESSLASAADLIAFARSNPGKLSFASAGNGTTSHLAVEILKAQLGLHMVHIPYRGGAPAMTDLIGGQVDFMIEISANAMPHVTSGRLRALAVSTRQRLPSLPQVPALAESGAPSFHVTAWDGVLAPAGTPPEAIAAMSRAVRAALSDPETVAQLGKRGAVPSPLAGDEFGQFVRSEIQRWGQAVKASGAKVD